MNKLVLFFLAYVVLGHSAKSQGCIMIRNISGFGQYNLTDNAFTTSQWQVNINNRYFKSYMDFKENVNQNTPEQDQSIVRSYAMDVTVSRLMKKGWSLAASLP